LKIGGVSVFATAKRLIKEIGSNDLSGAAAEMAYRFFLALFPFFLFIAALGGFISKLIGIDNPTDRIMNEIGTALPADAASVLRTQLQNVIEERNPGLLSVGIIGTIWASSSGIQTVMKALNRAHEVRETRALVKRYGLALGITVLGGVSILGAFVIFLIGQVAGLQVADWIGLEGPAKVVFAFLRWPLAAVLLLFAVAFLYWAAPNIDLPFKFLTPGAVIFVVVWMVGSLLFGLYVKNFGSYNATYGSIGGMVVLLIWLYLTSFILLIGAQLNAVLTQEAIPEELPARAQDATTAETVPDHRKAEAGMTPGGRASRAAPSEGATQPAPNREHSQRRFTRPSVLLAALVAALAAWRVSRA
jgi:membrane protein